MARDIPELPINDSGNGGRIESLRFDIADAAVLMHAMMIAGNAAMMGSSSKVEGRIRYYQRKFLEACPPGYQHLRREEDLSDIAIAMIDSKTWSIHRSRQYRSSTEGKTVITVGDKRWSTSELTPEQHDELKACINAIVPLDCEQVERDDEIKTNW